MVCRRRTAQLNVPVRAVGLNTLRGMRFSLDHSTYNCHATHPEVVWPVLTKAVYLRARNVLYLVRCMHIEHSHPWQGTDLPAAEQVIFIDWDQITWAYKSAKASLLLHHHIVQSSNLTAMQTLKVALYSARNYDRRSFEGEQEHITAAGIEISYLEPHLNAVTAKLAEGHQAVCLFVNDDACEETLRVLHSQGIKYISMRCAGYNNVDLTVAKELGISVVNVPAYSPEAIAEFAVGMLLTIVRKYHKAYNRVREGNFLLDGLIGFNLEGKTIGIIGTGRIGLCTGRILSHGFRAKVIGYDPYPNPTAAAENGIQYVSLEELFKTSDVISLHCPLTPETKYIINEEALKIAKQGLVIVNTSRGALINTSDLIQGLKSGHVGAVGMDVYERESKYFYRDSSNKIIQDDQLSRLVSFHNVFISGHQAFLTREALSAIARTTVENLKLLEEGSPCPNSVAAN